MIHAVATGASDLDDYIETGRVKIKPNQNKAERDLDDYDPDNAYESLYDEDYDPYEDPRYKEAAAEEASLWEDEEAEASPEDDEDKPREDRDGWYGCDGRYADTSRQDDGDDYDYDEFPAKYQEPGDDDEGDG